MTISLSLFLIHDIDIGPVSHVGWYYVGYMHTYLSVDVRYAINHNFFTYLIRILSDAHGDEQCFYINLWNLLPETVV